MAVGLLIHTASLSLTGNHLVSAYLGAISGGIIIFIAEYFRPLHSHWIPEIQEILKDFFFYTVLIQVISPLVIYALIYYFLESLGFQDGIVYHAWPSHLNMFLQFILLAIGAEFFQYWWHRLAHTYKMLWPSHAIHHMPGKLYALNTSRFHFFDKLVEFVITILIFMILGASLELVSYYYVFFAVTGFIQHSNCDAKLGWMDYVIASGETHRFHHDSDMSKSKCNYANNLVLWDLVFGTFKRDIKKPIDKIGMLARDLPRDVLGESAYPAKETWRQIRVLSDKQTKKAMNALTPLKMTYVHFTGYKTLLGSARDPEGTQFEALDRIVRENETTLFGSEHSFPLIHSVEDFKARVPIREYEAIRPYIEKIFQGQTNVLTSLEPHYFTKTSGTTGKPKYIPVNKTVQDYYLKAQKILSHAIYLNEPKTLSGLFFTVVGSKEEEILFGKWAAGSMSGKLFTLMPKILARKHVFPKELGDLQDHEKKYLYLAALALLAPEVTLYASPNPSTLLKIFETMNAKKEEIRDLLSKEHDPYLKKFIHNKAHAYRMLSRGVYLDMKAVWPNISSVVLWKGGSCAFLLPHVQKLAGPGVHIIELGYLCSEFFGTVTIDTTHNLQIPTLQDNFFEFIQRDDYERGERETLLLQDLRVGAEYYVIVTTPGGLYRYFINDILRVKDFLEKTPTFEFVQKGKGVTNLTGEKLSEFQVVSFFETLGDLKTSAAFFMCLADAHKQKYTLYIESADEKLEKEISLEKLESHLHHYLCSVNIEYESKVASRRLEAVRIVFLKKGTGEIYRSHCLQKGQRESQFKVLHLQYVSEVDFPFNKYGKE